MDPLSYSDPSYEGISGIIQIDIISNLDTFSRTKYNISYDCY